MDGHGDRFDWETLVNTTTDHAVFHALEQAFNAAMVSNDVEQIATCISGDWVLVTPERGPIAGHFILDAIKRKVLLHDSMTKQIHRIAVYGDIAIVTGRGQNTGTFHGQPIAADEWITDVYRREAPDRWACVLTHLTPALATEGTDSGPR